ncbi:MAG: phosphoribosylanthranilate isomerase [candidate division Zixibacteria bacterium]|nr:phosphoribosylanthranilate isomerase [candidate division Zixibacteria bacterium]
MATRIKICGITNLADAQKAVEFGANALGFVFAESLRQAKPPIVEEIVKILPPFVSKVGVFVNEEIDTVKELYSSCKLDIVQLHGDEDIQYIESLSIPFIKAFKVDGNEVKKQIKEFGLPYFLLDTYDKNISGGTGKSFDWQIAKESAGFGNVILSGGLNPDNIKEALETVKPYAVDVSSGIEKAPGKKDHQKMKYFINEVRKWDSRIS